MLDNILNIIKEQTSEVIKGSSEIQEDKKEGAIKVFSESIGDTFKEKLSGGEAKEMMNMLSGKSKSDGNPIMDVLKNKIIGGLSSKLGMQESSAGSIVSSLLPMIISKVIGKTSASGFDFSKLAGSLGSNLKDKAGDLAGSAADSGKSVLNKVFGG
ncbi:MAG: hypothetical protein DWQ44_13020 [Bacteroidetes bacterium]|nr:MAG: hypothetical protein DWQ33_13405 [Bacteroidota bacterium]REK05809.1 MAG: hypothetical protein DWQ39_05230 [Bacteroidota bacterium]REK31887.1 MAG: hypothetical protein DWQ44_13020 [Bacteroidota bacterium]REK49952.1 MAG: hypothetical protein DWQ48_05240 [Bacteroidota bacterium]